MSDEERLKWDEIHADRGLFPREPSAVFTALQPWLPPSPGTALDVAGGTGRHAFWLADQGFSVTLLDISATALQIASGEAAKRGLPLKTVCADLESDPLPPGPWDLLVCFHYLHRPLVRRFADELAPDGVAVIVHPTVRNLERHPRPGKRYLLAEGGLPDLAAAANLEIVHQTEGWSAEGRHEAIIVAKPAPGSHSH